MTPDVWVALVMLVGLVLYLVGGGADFGGGVWDLLASGPRKQEQRALIERTIGPLWEANHVWFIFVFVLLFSAFPPAFAEVMNGLFTPLTLFAFGLVMRGSAFTFRHYDARASRRSRWGALFSAASVGCPFLLGAMGGALVREQPLSFHLDAFVIACGAFLLCVVAALAATYLTLEARDEALREDFRRRALISLGVAGVASWVVLLTANDVAPQLVQRVAFGGLGAVGGVLGLTALGLVWTRRFGFARIAVGALVVAVVFGWAAAKGQVLVWPAMTLESTRAHAITLQVLLGACVVAAVLVVPSLVVLFRVFRPTR